MNRVIFGVLQQYARSGLFQSMYIFSNEQIVKFTGDESIGNMFNGINKAIANVVENINYFSNQDPLFGSHHEAKNISRIRTVSYGELEKNEENLYFLLDNITETHYIIIVSKEEINKNKQLLNVLKQKMLSYEAENVLASFSIFQSEHSQTFFYSTKFTHVIQEENL